MGCLESGEGFWNSNIARRLFVVKTYTAEKQAAQGICVL